MKWHNKGYAGRILNICGAMAEVDMFKKFDFLFSADMSYLNGVL
jgi:hypothetical protein